MKIYLDGKLVDKKNAVISVFDPGLLYGDGVFEGIRAYNGRVFRLKEHLNRLYNSAKAIMLHIPLSMGDMQKAVINTLRTNKLKDAYIRLVVTRGIGDLGLDPRKCPKATIFIITDKIKLYPQEYYKNGLNLITSSIKRSIPDALNPCIKSLNYLNNILAKIECIRADVPEAIMLNQSGYVAECTGDNVFIIKDSEVITPPSWAGALNGITRQSVMDLAKSKLKLKVREDILTLYDLYASDECFLTGTAAEVIPVVKIDGRVIGTGKPGKITLNLIREFRKLAKSSGVKI